MARKELAGLLAAAALFIAPNIADCQAKSQASQQLKLTGVVPPKTVLYVNESDYIVGIGLNHKPVSSEETNIEVYKNSSKVLLSDKIEEQYYICVNHPEITGVDLSSKKGWNYYQIDPQSIKDFEAKLQDSGILYITITEK